MRLLNILIFSCFSLNSMAETINGIDFVNADTDPAFIQRNLFGTPKQVSTDDWEAKSIFTPDESKGIEDELAIDQPKIMRALIQFVLDSANIDAASYPVLGKFGQALHDAPTGVRVQITGHADCLGKQRYNAGLALERAQAVQTFLINTYNLPANLLQVSAKGETMPLTGKMPVADTDAACRMAQSDAQRQLNRRVEFQPVQQ